MLLNNFEHLQKNYFSLYSVLDQYFMNIFPSQNNIIVTDILKH